MADVLRSSPSAAPESNRQIRRSFRPLPQPQLTTDVVQWIRDRKQRSDVTRRKSDAARRQREKEDEEDRIWRRFPGPLCPALFSTDVVGSGRDRRRRKIGENDDNAGNVAEDAGSSVRGVMATRPIPAGSLIIKMPKEALITTESVLAGERVRE